jgi:hypothetical protein
MGYVHDTHMHTWIPCTAAHCVTGTWTMAAGAVANTIAMHKSANAETATVTIPILLPMNDGPEKGAYLTSVDVYFEQLAAAPTSCDALIHKVTLPADTVAIGAPESLAFSYDTGNDTAGERDNQDQHTMTLTLTTPLWIEDDVLIQVQLTFVCGGAVTLDILGARANYTLRY